MKKPEILESFSSPVDTEHTRNLYAPMVEALLVWFSQNKRDLPWRQSHDPYAVWISEIMLQQTQMERGVAYFTRWMKLFPTLESVAAAPVDSILKAWEGLGYYTRARNLHKAAQLLVSQYGGCFPSTVHELRSLPGVGEYTAGAIASIAFNKPEPAVDANAERVFSRLFDIAQPCKTSVAAGFIRQVIETIIPVKNSRQFNQGIMELGSLVCKKKPLCEQCPVQAYCQAYRLGIVHERPVLGRKAGYAALEVVSGVLVHRGHVFIQKRLETGMWAGLWEFPGGRLEENEAPEQAVVREFMEETAFAVTVVTPLALVLHAYTRYRVRVHCFLCTLADTGHKGTSAMPKPTLEAASAYCWVLPEELDQYTFPAGHRKLLDKRLADIAQYAGT